MYDKEFMNALERGEHLSDFELKDCEKNKNIPQFSDASDDLHLSHSVDENGQNLWKVLDKNFQELRDNMTPAALNDVQVIRDELQALKEYCNKNDYDISNFRG